jgi:hypothetical protein
MGKNIHFQVRVEAASHEKIVDKYQSRDCLIAQVIRDEQHCIKNNSIASNVDVADNMKGCP